jgi:hypothetical protein
VSQDYPNNMPVVGDDKTVTLPWNQWFQRVQNVVVAVNSSGTTATRPTKLLWVGRPYFDTTLGKPVWVKSVGPVVWVDATGATV